MIKSAEGLQSTVSHPGQSPGGGPRSKAMGSSVYLGFENLLLQLKINHLLLITAQFTNYIAY